MERCRNNRRTYYVYLLLEILPKMNVLNLEVEILGPQDIYKCCRLKRSNKLMMKEYKPKHNLGIEQSKSQSSFGNWLIFQSYNLYKKQAF